MPTFYIDLGKDELLDELTDQDLIVELRERGVAHISTNDTQKYEPLQEAADMFRKAGKPNLSIRIEELIEELGI